MSRSLSHSDLRWQAFQYASGELTGAAARDFEALLAEDESACIALAETVLLCQSVAALERESVDGEAGERKTAERVAAPPSVRVKRTHAVQPVTLGGRRLTAALIAASVLLATALATWMQRDPEALVQVPRPVGLDRSGVQAPVSMLEASVVGMWVDLTEEDFRAAEEAALSGADEEVSGESDDVPDWMFAALAAASPQPALETDGTAPPPLEEQPL